MVYPVCMAIDNCHILIKIGGDILNQNLNDLLMNDKEAKEFYMGLSEPAQGALETHTHEIHSKQDLVNFIQNM